MNQPINQPKVTKELLSKLKVLARSHWVLKLQQLELEFRIKEIERRLGVSYL